jgi:chromosome partitioning protein
VWSASPPTDTTERAGIAEASPAGEKGGREAVPGRAQGGETSTVDQSREWPFRDTTPRQDPAESRVEPIWGADPPDAVRWHIDMAPDQAPASRSPTSSSPGATSSTGIAPGEPSAEDEPAGAESYAAADPPTGDLSIGDSPAAGATGRHPDGQDASSIDSAAANSTDPASVEAWSATGSAGSGGDRADPGPGVVTATEGSVVGGPHGAGSGVGWFSPEAGVGLSIGPLSERLSAERPGDGPIPPPTTQTGPGSDAPIDAGGATTPMEDSGAGAGSPGGRAAGLEAAPNHAAAAEPGGAQSGMASPGTELPPFTRDLRSPELIEAGMVYVDPDPEIGSPTHAAGWAEQPAARLGPEDPGGGRSAARSGDDAQGSTEGDSSPTGIGEAEAGDPIGVDAPIDAVDLGGIQEVARTEEATGAEVAMAGHVGAPESEPTIDAAPAPGTVEEAMGATAITHSQVAGDRADGSDDPDIRERTDAGEFGEHIGDAPRGDAPRIDLLKAARRADASEGEGAGSSDAGEISPQSAPYEDPWNEPALPMAWPPGMTPPDRGERSGSLHEDSDAGDLPEPDPTWPKLFGQSSAPREPGAQAELAGGVHATVSVDQVSGERGANDPSSGQQEAGERPAVIDITSHEPGEAPRSGGSAEAANARAEGTDPQPETMTGARSEHDIDAVGHANMSTVVQDAKTEEGEVDLRETPANPQSIDVSRETSAGGGAGMDPGLESEDLEDEAAVAVREAASRAAAEAGVDVSRETESPTTDFSIDELSDEPSIDRESAARNARVTFRIDRDALNGDRRVMAVANQKGGVGKSTTAVNLGAYLALAGARVLVVDLDPQGNASTGLGLDHRDIEPSIYDVLTGEAPPAAAIRPTGVANLHVLPSTIDLAGAEVELVSAMSRETRLRRALESIDHQYDSILIDCPPSLGLLTVNALAAADELLIPIQCEYYALEGLGQLLRNVELVRANLNPDLRIGGIVLTMYDGRTRLALQVVDEVRKHFTDVVYQTVVPRSVRLSEAPGYGLPIALYDPLSRGGIAYRDLTFELAERSGLLAPTGEGAS